MPISKVRKKKNTNRKTSSPRTLVKETIGKDDKVTTHREERDHTYVLPELMVTVSGGGLNVRSAAITFRSEELSGMLYSVWTMRNDPVAAIIYDMLTTPGEIGGGRFLPYDLNGTTEANTRILLYNLEASLKRVSRNPTIHTSYEESVANSYIYAVTAVDAYMFSITGRLPETPPHIVVGDGKYEWDLGTLYGGDGAGGGTFVALWLSRAIDCSIIELHLEDQSGMEQLQRRAGLRS